MDVTKILEHDHDEVEQLFDKIEKAEGDDRRNADRDPGDREQRPHALPEEILEYQRDQGHRPERALPGAGPHR